MKYIHKHGLSKHVPDLLKHEVGHILGLTWSRDEFCHCTDKSCLMHRYYDASSLKDHEQKHLCPDCQANLAKAQSDVPDSRLSFLGPVMVRSEEDYQVLSLPGFVKIHFGTLDTVHWQDVVCEAQKQVPRHAPMSGRVAILVGAPKNQIHNRVQLVQAIENAKQDPCSTVRLGITAITRRTMLVPPVSQKDQLASNLD